MEPSGLNKMRTQLVAARTVAEALVDLATGPAPAPGSFEGPVEAIPIGTDTRLEDAHAQATGFDPRTLAEQYIYLQIAPQNIQAWREANELEDRHLMRRGIWLD